MKIEIFKSSLNYLSLCQYRLCLKTLYEIKKYGDEVGKDAFYQRVNNEAWETVIKLLKEDEDHQLSDSDIINPANNNEKVKKYDHE